MTDDRERALTDVGIVVDVARRARLKALEAVRAKALQLDPYSQEATLYEQFRPNEELQDLLEFVNEQITEAGGSMSGDDVTPSTWTHTELLSQNERLKEALTWCSGSADFGEGGKAREGWLKICQPLLKREAGG